MKRIFIGSFKQESNSFCPVLTEYWAFSHNYREGNDLIHSNGRAGQTVTGFTDILMENGFEPVGGVGMFATSGGPIRHTIAKNFIKRTRKLLRESGPLDGILLNLHGATVSERSEDVCGDILEAVREEAGEKIPISITCDMHANVTERFLKTADIICGYQTYPHIDFYETGCRAANLLIRKINGDSVKTAAAFIPMMASASGYTTSSGKLKSLMDYAHKLVIEGKILDYSIFQVQPWLDISKISSCILTAASDADNAISAANDLAEKSYDIREDIQYKNQYSIEDAVRASLLCPKDETVILVDSADSAGAGSCSDSAAPLEFILPYRKELTSAVSVTDPDAVRMAFSIGVGGKGDFEIGGKLAPKISRPVLIKNAVVKSLHNGEYVCQGPVERGQKCRLGNTAVIQADEISILISSNHGSQRDIQFFRGFGIEPSVCRLVCVKANTSFIAGYSSVKARIYNVVTPGSACPVLQELPYERLPKPYYPFQEIRLEDIIPAECYRF